MSENILQFIWSEFVSVFHQVCDRTVGDVVKMMGGLDKNSLLEVLHSGVENQVCTTTDPRNIYIHFSLD
jgi:hypothetical protein